MAPAAQFHQYPATANDTFNVDSPAGTICQSAVGESSSPSPPPPAAAAATSLKRTKAALLALRIVQVILSVACVILSSITLNQVTDVLHAFDDLAAAKDFTADFTAKSQLMVTVKGRDMYHWVLDGSSNPEAVRKDIVAMVVVSVILMVFFITTLVLTAVSLVLISSPNLRNRSSCCGSHRACRTFTMDIAVDGVLAVLWLALFIAAAVLDPPYVQNSIGALVMSVLFVATVWLSFIHRSQILSSPGEKGGADWGIRGFLCKATSPWTCDIE